MATAVGVSGIGVVFLYVSDMERSRSFYRDLLGIPLDGDDQWVEATFPGGVRFALHAAHEDTAALSSGTMKVSFTVADADGAAEALRAQGIEVREVMRDEWGTALALTDPDGYTVNLFQPPA